MIEGFAAAKNLIDQMDEEKIAREVLSVANDPDTVIERTRGM
ncbi:MAG: hypothetical protein ACRDT4_04850 [Micromonosporaceae bacterium]